MDIAAAEHEKISLQLIKLVKRHEELYKHYERPPHNSNEKLKSWSRISKKMNELFRTDHRKHDNTVKCRSLRIESI